MSNWFSFGYILRLHATYETQISYGPETDLSTVLTSTKLEVWHLSSQLSLHKRFAQIQALSNFKWQEPFTTTKATWNDPPQSIMVLKREADSESDVPFIH